LSTRNEHGAKIVRLFDDDPEEPDSPLVRRFSTALRTHAKAVTSPHPATRNWAIPGVAAFGEVTFAFGSPGSTKSLFGEDRACRAAVGLNWDGSATEYQFNVLYVAAERPGQVERRVTAFCRHHDIPPLDNLVIFNGQLDLCEPGSLAALLTACRQWVPDGELPDIVVIDTLAAAMSRPVSDTSATNAVAHNLAFAANGMGGGKVAILAIHHSTLDAPNRLAGGHLTAAADIAIRVEKRHGIGHARVVKDNSTDEEEWPSWSYRPFGVGVTYLNGEAMNEAVALPVIDDAPAAGDPKPDGHNKGVRAPRLTKDARAAFEALEAIGEAATEEVWRAAFKDAAGKHRNAAAVRMAFNRARNALTESEHVREQDGLFAPRNDRT
jgi:hypothetical protein